MLTSTFLPGASYSAGVWTIPATALNAVLDNTITGKDSAELLIYSLLQCLFEKQNEGSLSQPHTAVEVSAKNSTQSVWESSTNVFSNCYLTSYLVSFNFTTAVTESGNNIAVLT